MEKGLARSRWFGGGTWDIIKSKSGVMLGEGGDDAS